IYTKARLAAITPSASSADLTKRGGKYMLRMVSPSSVYARNLAQYTMKELGKKSVAVVHAPNEWGVQMKDHFAKEVEKLGARVAALEVVRDSNTDFTARLKKIKGAAPDALAILTYYVAGALVRARPATSGSPRRWSAPARFRRRSSSS